MKFDKFSFSFYDSPKWWVYQVFLELVSQSILIFSATAKQ